MLDCQGGREEWKEGERRGEGEGGREREGGKEREGRERDREGGSEHSYYYILRGNQFSVCMHVHAFVRARARVLHV